MASFSFDGFTWGEMACNEDCDQILLAGNKTSDEGWRENGESLEIWEKFIIFFFGQIRFTTKMAEDCRGFGKRRRPWSAEVWTGEPLAFHFVFFSSIGNCWSLTTLCLHRVIIMREQ